MSGGGHEDNLEGTYTPIERSTRASSPTRIAAATRRLLDTSTLCAISTTSPRGRAHQTHVGAAIAVYDSTQVWGELDQGLQLFGSARQVAGPAAMDAERSYAKRFPTYAVSDLGAYRFYRFRPRRIKVFDEQTLGAGLFVTAAVRGGGGLAWTRTELYHGQA